MNDENHQAEGNHDLGDLAPRKIVDLQMFGRRLRALRMLEGYDRASDFTSVLRSRFGIDMTDRTLYAIERGEQMPHLDMTLAIVAVLHPPVDYFSPAIRSDVMQAVHRRRETL